jgi:23S rRNA (cytidine1920-2'-O)/16S rRNA (cytidine1409-2'-O)-methyltransferase
MDVSFISATKVLPAVVPLLKEGGRVVVLIKPQFEVGKGEVGKGGIVRDPGKHLSALRSVVSAASALGFGVRGACPSPITGAEGNREFFLHLAPSPSGCLDGEALDRAIEEAVHGG